MAAQRLGWEEIPARIEDARDAVQMREIMIRENEQRKGDSMVRKGRKLRGYWEEMEAAHNAQWLAEHGDEGGEIPPLTEKVKISAACAIFGVSPRQLKSYALLGYNASPKVLKAAEKGQISDSVAVEIVERAPDDFPRQERHLLSILAKDQGRTKKEFLGAIGERPVKAKELLELGRDRADISSKVKVPLKEFALFCSGKMKEEDREKFLAANEAVAIWLEEDAGGEESSEGGEGEEE